MSATVDTPVVRRPYAGGGLAGAIVAEWVKLRSVRSPYICLVAGVAVTAVFAFYYGSIARINDAPRQPVGNAPVTSLLVGQFVFVVLAMITVTSEYATSSVRTSLLGVPVRHRVLLAKAVVNAVVAFAGGVLFGVLGMAVAWAPFQGHATFAVSEAAVQLCAMGLYCALVAVLAVGVSFALRASAGALTALFVLVSAAPSALTGLGGDVLLTLNDYLPQTAGMHMMHGGADAPYPAVVAALIVVAWTAAAQVAGLLMLQRRDA
ncbi:ABC transporter permease [Streptomyces sp. NPDC007100]|uniref:ABC transporter permease n=1 Tax=Streptomyces sp. NPDC007100 TaxID=3155602 RepID=UPI0033E8D2A2